jgi:hypothetical protein
MTTQELTQLDPIEFTQALYKLGFHRYQMAAKWSSYDWAIATKIPDVFLCIGVGFAGKGELWLEKRLLDPNNDMTNDEWCKVVKELKNPRIYLKVDNVQDAINLFCEQKLKNG